jgi:hypothetical protein
MDFTEIKKNLSDQCAFLRADIPALDQKIQSPLNYCAAILEESLEILDLVELSKRGDNEKFLEGFTAYWESKMKEVIDAL